MAACVTTIVGSSSTWRPQNLPAPKRSMIVNPLLTVTDDVMCYKFKRGDSTYLLTWMHSQSYEVELYKASADQWVLTYQGSTMGRPRLRQTNEHLVLYLVRPYFQIGRQEPKPGYDYYELVEVSEAAVNESIVQLKTLID